jgi:hypothetical protein
MKLRMALALISMLVTYNTALACSDASTTSQLTKLETEKLLSNAPTLKHAWQDKAISIQFKDSKMDGNQCISTLELHLPKSDLDEANQHLDQNPAKRILTAAQGYEVPESTIIQVPFSYQVIEGKVMPAEPNTAEVKRLHNNLEYTYQLLAQLRIHVDENSTNNTAWAETELQVTKQNCIANKSFNSKGADFCSCRAEKLSKAISPRQMELVNYIETQPFSIATGSMNGFYKLSENINQACTAK